MTDPRATARLLACSAARTLRVERGVAETSWGPDGLATWMAVRAALRPWLGGVGGQAGEFAERVRRVVAGWPARGVIDPMRESVRVVGEVGAGFVLGEPSPSLVGLVERELTVAARPRLLRGGLRAAQLATYAAIRGHRDATPLSDFDEHTRALAVRTLLLAGHHVPAAALAWTLHELARHPEAQREIRADPRFAAVVVREALRLHPPVWRLERRLDAPVDGFPEGTVLLFSPYVNQRDHRVFPDPHEFRPGRWRRDPRPPPGAYFPFALGPRGCPGARLALTLLSVTLSVVLDTHELVPHREPRVTQGVLHHPRGARIGLRPVGDLARGRSTG
ncbi:cytochrome P450 [Actinokineospora sp. UTMC 2448]|uniref:cytochrome P450 n=1 Tax=Actinokineospora sp. UTMC 2448 TaxID=2268449 RepID=UPI0021644CFD|nr:cytochrome P450 [Actinokineospora sp. UTMC 2448]